MTNEPNPERSDTRLPSPRRRSQRQPPPAVEASAKRPRGEPFSTLYGYLDPESENPIEPFSDSEYNGL